MNKNIDQEIEKMAESLEKASTDPLDQTIKLIKSLGKEGLQAKLATLNDEEKETLKYVITKAISFDKEINAASFVQGKVTDTIIQEDKVDDDIDETLVKESAAKMDNQGTPTPGWEGQVIKGEDMKNISDEVVDQVVEGLLEKGMAEDIVKGKCEGKGMDKMKVQGAVDKFKKKKSDKEEIEKAEKMSKETAAKKIMDMEEKEHGTKDPKKLVDAEKKENMKKSEDEPQSTEPIQKSVSWDDENRLLKANTLGRNFHFNAGEYLEKASTQTEEQPIQKSIVQGQEDVNDLIAKSEDKNWNQIDMEKSLEASKEAQNGHLYKSFDEVTDLAAIMGISEEQAKKILG